MNIQERAIPFGGSQFTETVYTGTKWNSDAKILPKFAVERMKLVHWTDADTCRHAKKNSVKSIIQ